MKKRVYKVFAIIFAVILIIFIIFFIWYKIQQRAVNQNINENNEIIINIESGTSTTNILKILKEKNIIRSDLAAKIYIKLNNLKGLQAGKYSFTGNENLNDVLGKLVSGNVKNEEISITFQEGKNIRNVAKKISQNTDNTEEAVFKLLQDENYINKLINEYWFLTSEIKNKEIYYPLEGYLYPETYIFENRSVSLEEIFAKMLNQTDKILTKYKTQIQKSKWTIHELLTIASISELEGNTPDDRAKIVQVIYNRMKQNMSIGSDVTTYYAIKVDMGERNLYNKEINTYNAYNTRGPKMQGKLPIGPIANISEESLNAVLNPIDNNYLYFVADKNGKIYYANTYEEHQLIISKLQEKGLWYNY